MWYKNMSFWSVIIAAFAVLMSQLPPVVKWIPEQDVKISTASKIGLRIISTRQSGRLFTWTRCIFPNKIACRGLKLLSQNLVTWLHVPYSKSPPINIEKFWFHIWLNPPPCPVISIKVLRQRLTHMPNMHKIVCFFTFELIKSWTNNPICQIRRSYNL